MTARPSDPAAGPVAAIERWERFGGTWQILESTHRGVTVSLRRCDGGEEVERLTSADPALLAWLADHTPPG